MRIEEIEALNWDNVYWWTGGTGGLYPCDVCGSRSVAYLPVYDATSDVHCCLRCLPDQVKLQRALEGL